ncbi:MAG: substrate-binding domain-containing protein [Kiritimatiellae bacterium]|nr:substrate-binding domain-containing protein [Kiritimatiellia bacterium]
MKNKNTKTVDLTLDRSRNLPEQITGQMRALLSSGRIPVGMRLPSTEALARQWETHVPYVHAALKALVVEGWLERRHGSGTFVCEKRRKLRTVGIYYSGGMLADAERRFLRSVHQALIAIIEGSGRRWSLWDDPRPYGQYGEAWSELESAVQTRELDALIVPSCDFQHYQWLSRLPAPTAFMTTNTAVPNRVDTDHDQMVRLAIDSLVAEGCRSLGLISATPARLGPDNHSERDTEVYRTFMAFCREKHIRTLPAWTITSDAPGLTHASCERWGYDAFQRLWTERKHPDGLIAIMDAEALGVTMAILERGVRVPGELRVAMHKNEGVDLPCPFTATHIVNHPAEAARGLIEIVERQFDGRTMSPVMIGFEIKAAEQ